MLTTKNAWMLIEDKIGRDKGRNKRASKKRRSNEQKMATQSSGGAR